MFVYPVIRNKYEHKLCIYLAVYFEYIRCVSTDELYSLHCLFQLFGGFLTDVKGPFHKHQFKDILIKYYCLAIDGF